MAPGYETNDEAGAPLVIKLRKSLYGLRQSPKNWFGTIGMKLAIIGVRPLKSDPCVYVYEDETGFVILTLYLDDILFLSASKSLLNKFKKQLMDRFETSDMSAVSRILGMNVTRDREKGLSPSARKTIHVWRTWYSAMVWKTATPHTPPE